MIAYIYFKFRNTAIKRTFALIFNKQFFTIERFFEWIEQVFEDSNPMFTVQIKIKSLKQKNRSFRNYLAEFFMYINDTDFNDLVQKFAFFDDLFNEFKEYLIFIAWRKINLVVFQKECERLKNVYKLINSYTSRNRNIKITIILFQITTFIVAQHSFFYISFFAGDLMNFFVNWVKRDPFIAAKKQDKRDREKCFYYKETGHFADNCFYKFIIRFVFIFSNFISSFQPARIETFQLAQKVQENA